MNDTAHPGPLHERRDRASCTLLWTTAVGGLAVLASYAWGLSTHADASDVLWGNVPHSIRPLYTISMVAATVGYFAFLHFLFVSLPSTLATPTQRRWHAALPWVFAGILVPSAVWMPLTFAHAAAPSARTWLLIRLVLLVVGLSSVVLATSLVRWAPRTALRAWRLAVAGAIAFSFQTAILDALVWPHVYLGSTPGVESSPDRQAIHQ